MNTDEILTKIYYNPNHRASFSNLRRLLEACKKKKLKISKKSIEQWLMQQDCYTRHRPRRKIFPRKSYLVDNIDDLWEIDLMVFENQLLKNANDGVCYILGMKKKFREVLVNFLLTFIFHT